MLSHLCHFAFLNNHSKNNRQFEYLIINFLTPLQMTRKSKKNAPPINLIVGRFKSDFAKKIRKATESKKLDYSYEFALTKMTYVDEVITDRDDVMIDFIEFIESNPLKDNDFWKYGQAYKSGTKLDEKYFRYDLGRLQEIYTKIDEDEGYTSYTEAQYQTYVLFMMMTHSRIELNDTEKELFKPSMKGNREFNPLTNIPRGVRAMLPEGYEFDQYDIKSAYPTFIDRELGITTRKQPVYELLKELQPNENAKVLFNMTINTHSQTKGATIESCRATLKPIYSTKVDEVITEERFNNRGQLYTDMTAYEKRAIELFVDANDLIYTPWIRLHDAVLIPRTEKPLENLTQEGVLFKYEPLQMAEMREGYSNTFYKKTVSGKAVFTPVMLEDFFKQEKILRGYDLGVDEAQILKDTNKVLELFNKESEMISYLATEINEVDKTALKNLLAGSSNTIKETYKIMQSEVLEYYKDSLNEFGMLFGNGKFVSLLPKSERDASELKVQVTDVMNTEGFFAPHKYTQDLDFELDTEMGDFEKFFGILATGKQDNGSESDTLKIEQLMTAFGYLAQTNKNMAKSYAVVLTDADADGTKREGRRGKSLFMQAVMRVTNTHQRNEGDFDPTYTHRYGGIDKSVNVLAIDDVNQFFSWDTLFPDITADMFVETKNKTGFSIPFEVSPKMMFTTNYVFRAKDSSTLARFKEYKIPAFFNINRTPESIFGNRFFSDWDTQEWNKFYSFVFKCVALFHEKGLMFEEYDKSEDEFNALLSHDADLYYIRESIEYTINAHLECGRGDCYFTATQILSRISQMRREEGDFSKMTFSPHNIAKYINAYVGKMELPFEHSKKSYARGWFTNSTMKGYQELYGDGVIIEETDKEFFDGL